MRSKEKLKGAMSMNGFQMNPIVGIGFCAWKATNAMPTVIEEPITMNRKHQRGSQERIAYCYHTFSVKSKHVNDKEMTFQTVRDLRVSER